MDLTVVLDHKFRRNVDGQICAHSMFGEAFWGRYLQVFDNVRIVCRVANEVKEDFRLTPIRDPRLSFHPVPYYEGPSGFCKRYLAISKSLRESLEHDGAVILRVPQILPTFAQRIIRKQGRSYAVEVVGDPWDVYSPGAEMHPFRSFFRHFFTRRLREVCRHAAAASYVTESALQKRYPPGPKKYSTYASDVEVGNLLQQARKPKSFEEKPFRLLFIGTLNRLYKGQDLLIEAVSRLVSNDIPIELTIVGEGQYRSQLEALAERLGTSDHVRFLGHVPHGRAIFDLMDRSNLFVLPSRQEGLARVVIEAMTRGLPVLSSDVGGMSEVVPRDCLLAVGSVDDIVKKVSAFLNDPARLAAFSQMALEVASRFVPEAIEPRRLEFYQQVRAASAFALPGSAERLSVGKPEVESA